jgi:redox-sensitive bicupin YhaK (pirin superfamily)
MDDPRYGTEPPENIPILSFGPGANARVMAGTLWSSGTAAVPVTKSSHFIHFAEYQLETQVFLA